MSAWDELLINKYLTVKKKILGTKNKNMDCKLWCSDICLAVRFKKKKKRMPEHSSPVHFHCNRAQLKLKASFER